MADDEERTSSDDEYEAIEAAINDDDDVRYSLRSRSVSKSQSVNTNASTGASAVVPPHTSEGTQSYTDGETRVNYVGAPRVTLPFQFDRRDIPYVPAYAAMSQALSPAGEYATRMTAREQERYGHYDGQWRRPRVEDGMSWLDYHRVFEEQSESNQSLF